MTLASTDWGLARTKYIATNLEADREKPYTYKELATDLGITHETVRKRASTEKWSAALTEAIADRDAKAIATLTEETAFDEYETRARHATVGKYMIARGVAKLQSVEDLNSMTVKEAIEMTRVGVELERKSVGIKDGALFIANVSIGTFNWHAEHDKLSEYIMTLSDDEIHDIEFEEVE